MPKKQRERDQKKKLKKKFVNGEAVILSEPSGDGNNKITLFDGTTQREVFIGDSLDLLEYCHRAIGEWQNFEVNQGRLLNVETDCRFPLTHFDGEIKEDEAQLLEVQPKEDFKCTQITLAEMHECEDNAFDKNESKFSVPVMNLDSFMDTTLTQENGWLFMERETLAINSLTIEEMEMYYWISKLRGRDLHILVSILNSFSYLVDLMEIKNWRLPNGQEVPIESLRLILLEVAPRNIYVIRNKRFYQSGPDAFGSTYELKSDTPPENLSLRRIDPILGPIYSHFILEVPLDTGESYVIDPTSSQFNYRGPKGSIIMHGDWETYSNGFPGTIVNRINMQSKDFRDIFSLILEETSDMGYDEPVSDKLKINLFKYFACRICSYCGKVEKPPGGVPGTEKIRDNLYFKIRPVKLLDCGRCKSATYCGKLCQIFMWKNHKTDCKRNAKLIEKVKLAEEADITLQKVDHLGNGEISLADIPREKVNDSQKEVPEKVDVGKKDEVSLAGPFIGTKGEISREKIDVGKKRRDIPVMKLRKLKID